jgi:hypothetical protein
VEKAAKAAPEALVVPANPTATARLRLSNQNHPTGSTILRIVGPVFLWGSNLISGMEHQALA